MQAAGNANDRRSQPTRGARALRRAPRWVAATLTTQGFTLGRGVAPDGMACLVARKV